MQLRLAAAVTGLIVLVLVTFAWRPPQAGLETSPPAEMVEDTAPAQLLLAPPPEDLAEPGLVRLTNRASPPEAGSAQRIGVAVAIPGRPPAAEAGSTVAKGKGRAPAKTPVRRLPRAAEAGSGIRAVPVARPAAPRLPEAGSVAMRPGRPVAKPLTIMLNGGLKSPQPVVPNFARHIVFSPDGLQLAVGDIDGRIRLYDVASRQQVREFKLSTGVLFDMIFMPDGSLLANSAGDILQLFDTTTGDVVRTYKPAARISVMVLAPGGEHLIAGSESGRVLRLTLTTGHSVVLGQHSGAVIGLAVSADGRFAATSGSERRLQVWKLDLPAGELGSQSPVIVEIAPSNVPNCLAFSPDSRRLIGTGPQSVSQVWKFDPGSGLTLEKHVSALPGANTVIFTTASDVVTFGARRSSVVTSHINLNTAESNSRLHSVPGGAILDTSLSSDNLTLAVLMQDGVIHFLHVDPTGVTVAPKATMDVKRSQAAARPQ